MKEPNPEGGRLGLGDDDRAGVSTKFDIAFAI
jgi:hypothetical protein